jgi:hypothetical protein
MIVAGPAAAAGGTRRPKGKTKVTPGGRDMELELATLHDISDELLRRKASFVLIAKEATNQQKRCSFWVSGNGMRRGDIMRIAGRCQNLFSQPDRRLDSHDDFELDP